MKEKLKTNKDSDQVQIKAEMVNENHIWKWIFWGCAAILLLVMILNANSAGSGGDDLWYGTHGEMVLKYYLDKDTSCLDYSKTEYHNMTNNFGIKYFAGAGFEIIPAVICRAFSIDNFLLVKRICLCCVGFLLMLFVGLIGRELRGWRLGIIAMLLCSLTPNIFGLSFCGGQDISSALGFAMAIYGLICFTKELPKISLRGSIFTFLGIMFATSVRISGPLTLLYFFIAVFLEFICRKDLRQLFVKKKFILIMKICGICLTIGIGAFLLGMCAYPNIFHEGLVTHFNKAFDVVSKFSTRIPFIYDGEMAESTNPPEHYLLYSLIRTLPYYIFIGAFLFLIFIVKIFKKYRTSHILFLIFAAAFPLIYIVASKANIYNGWRHELFFYAPFAVLVSIGWYELWTFVKTKVKNEKVFYPIVAAVMLVVVSPTLIWMVKNHNYIYCYYNKSVGNPYLRFELDYYETSATRAYDWLRENELNKIDSTVIVSTKIFTPVYYAEMLRDTDHVKVFTTSYMGFAETDCDYSIINYHVIRPKAIKKFFPPKGTIHVEYVDGNPICAVVKRNKLDSKGIGLVKKGKYEEGMLLLDSAYKYDPNNFGIWFWMGYGYYYTGKYEKSIEFFDKYIGFLPNNEMLGLAIAHKGVALYELKRYDEAIPILQNAEKICKANDLPFVRANLGLTYYFKGDYKSAIPYFEASVTSYPQLQGALSDCLRRI